MESEEQQQVSIVDSNVKLQALIEHSDGIPIDQVIRNYVKSLRYKPIEDFRNGLSWFNTNEPLSFQTQLKGKLVLLDFFTYCCINCMHILPDLKEIEQTFTVEDGLVVIGVHSAKFDNEKSSENVRNAILRYNIEHPVVNDDGADMWQKCEVHCWPTLLLISPASQPLVMLVGEGHKETLKSYIRHFLDHYNDQLSFASLPIDTSGNIVGTGASYLHFPGKLSIYETSTSPQDKIICISDSGKHRIVVIEENAVGNQSVTIVGNGQGFRDGHLHTAQFHRPQGVVFLNESVIFVADTENHAIRRIDLRQQTVSTVAGNGVQCDDTVGGRIGSQQGISSPWDVEVFKGEGNADILLVAMAGTHQIWAVFLQDATLWQGKTYVQGAVVCIAGSGREENRNNAYPRSAGFSQPSGLAVCQLTKNLYIADSESSTVRRLSLVDGKVSGVVGGDRDPCNLFAFGDRDGAGCDARLQHCLGISMAKGSDCGKAFVADTYNHKIKVVNTSTNQVRSIASSAPPFNEPGDVHHSSDGRLYVADTNNHAVRVCTLSEDLSAIVDARVLQFDVMAKSVNTIQCPKLLMTDTDKNIIFHLILSDLQWNDEARQQWQARMVNSMLQAKPLSGDQIPDVYINVKVQRRSFLHSSKGHIQDELEITFHLTCCKSNNTCVLRDFRLRMPIEVSLADEKPDQNDDMHINVIISQNDAKVTLNKPH